MGRGIGFRQFRILWGMNEKKLITYTLRDIRAFFPSDVTDSDIQNSLGSLSLRDLIHHQRQGGEVHYTITPDGEREVERSPHKSRYMAERYSGDSRQLDFTRTNREDS